MTQASARSHIARASRIVEQCVEVFGRMSGELTVARASSRCVLLNAPSLRFGFRVSRSWDRLEAGRRLLLEEESVRLAAGNLGKRNTGAANFLPEPETRCGRYFPRIMRCSEPSGSSTSVSFDEWMGRDDEMLSEPIEMPRRLLREKLGVPRREVSAFGEDVLVDQLWDISLSPALGARRPIDLIFGMS